MSKEFIDINNCSICHKRLIDCECGVIVNRAIYPCQSCIDKDAQLSYWKERCEWCERYVEYSTIEDDSDPVRKICATEWQKLKRKEV